MIMADSYTAIPLSPLRKVIATRMVEAKRTIPHFRAVCDIELDAVLAFRNTIKARDGSVPSLNDFLIKACAMALKDVPEVNAQWAESEIHQYSSADISVVTAVKGGLATPIVRQADAKTISQISREMKELAERAARNTLKMSEVFGGSFSISNLGMYGIDQFDAIINPPQCGIVAFGAAKPKVVVSSEGDTHVATVLRATLSVDHRAIDGVAAATFLATLRGRLEQPADLCAAL